MNPDELTQVSDSGEREQPTHLQLEGFVYMPNQNKKAGNLRPFGNLFQRTLNHLHQRVVLRLG